MQVVPHTFIPTSLKKIIVRVFILGSFIRLCIFSIVSVAICLVVCYLSFILFSLLLFLSKFWGFRILSILDLGSAYVSRYSLASFAPVVFITSFSLFLVHT